MARIKTAALLYFHDIDLTGDALTNAARYDRFFLKIDNTSLTVPLSLAPPVDWSGKVKTKYVDPIKALNPAIKMGLYVNAGQVCARPWDPAYVFATDAQCLHQPDGDVLDFILGGVHYRWPNYVRDGVRADHVAQYLAFCETYDIDMLFFDSWYPSFARTFLTANDAESVAGSQEGATHTDAYWISAMPTWATDLRDGLDATGRELYVNQITPGVYGVSAAEDALLGQDSQNILDYVHGALFETFYYYAYSTDPATNFPLTLRTITAAQSHGGAVFVLAIPWLFTIAFPAAPPTTYGTTFALPDATTLARYYLATYLLIQDERSSFGFQPFLNIAYFGFDSGVTRVYWSDDFNIDFGDAAGSYYVDGTLYVRVYSRGVAVVNPALTGATFTRAGTWRVWGEGPRIEIGPGDSDDTVVSGINLPPRTGCWMEAA